MTGFGNLDGLGQKLYKMDSRTLVLDHLGGLGQKCVKWTSELFVSGICPDPKITSFRHMGGRRVP